MSPKEIDVLAMGREFSGRKWLESLETTTSATLLRIKSNTIVAQKYAREHRGTRGAKATKREEICSMNFFFASTLIIRRLIANGA